jgi:hypothetical protein
MLIRKKNSRGGAAITKLREDPERSATDAE